MKLDYSFIIPVFNRPDEVEQLLNSIAQLQGFIPFEVIIIEDGSTLRCEDICYRYRETINIQYHYKKNTGPGDSRNFGMHKALSDYFIVLDSDCLLPPNYLIEVSAFLKSKYVDFFGGPDAAHDRFTILQKAINYSMTSLFTTGGIRGNKLNPAKFQPRSFNMGISKTAFEASQGFGNIHPGEDPDLVLRLWDLGFTSSLIQAAFVYHERRISWKLFAKQVFKFGKARVILNKWHPGSAKITYWFPTLFCLGFITAAIMFMMGFALPFLLYCIYFLIIGIHSWYTNSFRVALLVIPAVVIQFSGYGYGYLKSFFYLNILNKKAEVMMPEMFFKR